MCSHTVVSFIVDLEVAQLVLKRAMASTWQNDPTWMPAQGPCIHLALVGGVSNVEKLQISLLIAALRVHTATGLMNTGLARTK